MSLFVVPQGFRHFGERGVHRRQATLPLDADPTQVRLAAVDSVTFDEATYSVVATGGVWLVDSVEVAVMPVLLGTGIPLLPPGASTKLVLADQKTLPRSGIVVLSYSVPGGVAPAPPIRFVKPASRAPKKKTSARKTKKPSRRAAASRRRRA